MPRAPLALVMLAALLPACGSEPTAARLIFEFDSTIAMEQIRLEVVHEGTVVATADLPRRTAGPLASGLDVVVLFEDALAGEGVGFYAAGLHEDAQVATGGTTLTLVKGTTRTGHITLTATACGAGTHDCDGRCYSDDDPAHCGLACLACPAAPAHGTSSCRPGGCAVACDEGYAPCDGACVDLVGDAANCGSCGRACGGGEICQQGECRTNTCGSGTHPCGADCVADADPAHCGSSCTPCPDPANGGATCDGTSCGVACAGGFHACAGACVATSSTASCGASCTPCPAPANGYATCNGVACGVACDSGYHNCGGACVSSSATATCGISCAPCPEPANGYATCDGMGCGVGCDSGYHACSGACASNSSPSSCGSSCTPCPAPANGYATCNGTSCGVACNSGYHDCGGACASNGAPATCGASCTPCPPGPANSYTTCDGTSCGWACSSGYKRCGAACVPNAQSCTPTWTQVYPTHSPPGRGRGAMVFDADRGVTVLFGGVDRSGYTFRNDTWEWNGSDWAPANLLTAPPAARAGAGFAYDPVRHVMVVFGGENYQSTWVSLGDTWTFNGSSWTQVATTGPAARVGSVMAWDANAQKVVLFGGVGSSELNDTWEWNGSSWTQRSTSNAPSGRNRMGGIFDQAHGGGQFLIFGGETGVWSGFLAETWALRGNAWTQLAGGPSARVLTGFVYDSTRALGVLFGGYIGSSPYYLGDTWMWDGAAWQQLVTSASPPAMFGPQLAYDAARDRVVLFGGSLSSGDSAQTWLLSWQ